MSTIQRHGLPGGQYGYSFGPKGRIHHVGSPRQTLEAAWANMGDEEEAHIYRQADGYRFVGYLRRNGRFVDMRVEAL